MPLMLIVRIVSGVVLIIGMLAAPGITQAEQDKADDPNATVAPDAQGRAQALRQLLAFNQRTLIGDYRDYGVHNPAWDQNAEKLLELFAVDFTYDNRHEAVYRAKPLADAAAKYGKDMNLARKLIRAKCNDPLMLYFIGLVHAKHDKYHKAAGFYRRALKGFEDSEYPATRTLYCLNRLLDGLMFVRSFEVIEKRRKLYGEHMLQDLQVALEQIPAIDSAYARGIMASNFVGFTHRATRWMSAKPKIAYLTRFIEVVEAAQCQDEWLGHVLLAELLTDLAWVYRGGGWASSVSAEQWEMFEQHLLKARYHWEEAWAIEPSSLIAGGMITIAKAGHGRPGEDHWFWFHRGMEQMFDDGRLWDKMGPATLPGLLRRLDRCTISGRRSDQFAAPIL